MTFKFRRIKLIPGIKMLKVIKNFPLYIRDYFGMIEGGHIVYQLRNGIKYKVRAKTTDREGLNEMWVYNTYNPKGFEIKENDVVVDIGGHIGLFSVSAAKQARKGKVYTFEPDPENFELLKSNISLNGLENVTLVNKAVSFENSKRDFFLCDDNQEAHSFFSQNTLLFKKDKAENKITVDTVSFKDFVKKHKISKIDFLKIDCEGAEYEILYNCPKSILKNVQKISMEYHNINEILDALNLDPEADKRFHVKYLKPCLEKNGFAVSLRVSNKKRGMLYAKRINS